MKTEAPPSGPDGRTTRWLWLLFAAAWLVHFGFSAVGWDHTLLNRFQFRQVQTAIGTLFFPAGGFALDHELPLFGPPWAVPLEFPLYQALVAWFAQATGLALDPAGRFVSWVFFQAALPAWWLLLGSLGIARGHRPLFLALLVTSPIYLYFSRFFLMESTVLCGAAWFLAAYARWIARGGYGWALLAAVAGALAAMIKPPTMAVFGLAAGLLTLRELRRTPGGAPALLLRGAAAFALPLAAGLWWQIHSAGVRAANPEARILDVMFGYFSFGDLALRLSGEYWRRTIEVWLTGILSEGGLVLALLGLFRADAGRRLLALGAFAVFLSGQLFFAHLYFVHDYYFYANGVFLLIAAGLALLALGDDTALPFGARLALPAAVIALQIAAYARTYLPVQRVNVPVPELAQVLARLTDPDDVLVILGQDWDAHLPYYAQRRALMLVTGRERDPAAIARSVARLDRRQVGAVVLFGHVRNDSTFAAQAFGPLDLDGTPLLLNHDQQVGIWFPRERLPTVRDRLPEHGFATLDLVPTRPPGGGIYTLGQREISRFKEFAALPQRPLRVTSQSGFSNSTVEGRLMINSHAPSEIVFRCPPDLTRVEFSFGLHDGAYTNPLASTDGAEFALVLRRPGGEEQVLARRFIDPAQRREDQGIQRLAADLPAGAAGELCLRISAGPRDNASYDWAYFGEMVMHRRGK